MLLRPPDEPLLITAPPLDEPLLILDDGGGE
jgi:hypothetical protein